MARAAARSTERGACGDEGPVTRGGGACSGGGEAQGDVGARQCRHVLPSPRVIAAVASSLSVVGPWWTLEGEGVSISKKADRAR
jgi:hypothetical protein